MAKRPNSNKNHGTVRKACGCSNGKTVQNKTATGSRCTRCGKVN